MAHVAEELQVSALIRGDRNRLGVFLHGGDSDVGRRSIMTEVDDLSAGGLQDAAHDVDGRVVAVEQRRGGHDANVMTRFVRHGPRIRRARPLIIDPHARVGLTGMYDTDGSHGRIVPEPGSDEERAQFHDLQRRLVPLVSTVFPDRMAERTVVVVPSLSLDTDQLHRIDGIVHYEERMLCLLMLLRMPRTRIIYVTSRPIPSDHRRLLPPPPPGHPDAPRTQPADAAVLQRRVSRTR